MLSSPCTALTSLCAALLVRIDGNCDDRKVLSSKVVPASLPGGGEQAYRRISLKYAPISYNQNTVERRALISATSVRGSVFILVASCLATRYKTVQADLAEIADSFRAS